MDLSELVLVRHGETEGQSSIRLHGITDVELDALGRRQMIGVRRALSAISFDGVVTSPLRRCRTAASLVAPGLQITVFDEFREIDFGRWEGLTWDEIARMDPGGHAAWRREGPSFRFPGGEPRAGFRARVAAGTRRLTQEPGPRVLAVLHKGVIKVILGDLLGLDHDTWSSLPVDLGSIHHLVRTDGRWRLVTANATDHLPQPFPGRPALD